MDRLLAIGIWLDANRTIPFDSIHLLHKDVHREILVVRERPSRHYLRPLIAIMVSEGLVRHELGCHFTILNSLPVDALEDSMLFDLFQSGSKARVCDKNGFQQAPHEA